MSAAALLKAAHPGPSLAVTAVGCGLAAAAGVPPAHVARLGVALAAGQLAIGWTNDALDAERDVAAARSDKPVATGALPHAQVRGAAALAVLLVVPASLACGWRPGAAHLVAVGGGLAYDAGLKATPASAATFALSFGLLPAVATLALPAPRPPAAWAVGAGALLGVAAHLANALPDLDDDVAAGVAGVPQRLGARRTRLAGAGALVGAGLLAGGAAARRAPLLAAAGTAVAVAGAVAGFVRPWPPRSRAPFALAASAAVATVALVLSAGPGLVAGGAPGSSPEVAG